MSTKLLIQGAALMSVAEITALQQPVPAVTPVEQHSGLGGRPVTQRIINKRTARLKRQKRSAHTRKLAYTRPSHHKPSKRPLRHCTKLVRLENHLEDLTNDTI